MRAPQSCSQSTLRDPNHLLEHSLQWGLASLEGCGVGLVIVLSITRRSVPSLWFAFVLLCAAEAAGEACTVIWNVDIRKNLVAVGCLRLVGESSWSNGHSNVTWNVDIHKNRPTHLVSGRHQGFPIVRVIRCVFCVRPWAKAQIVYGPKKEISCRQCSGSQGVSLA